MANNYTTTSLEAMKYLCGLIRDLASVSEGIDDINLRSDGTFSSVMIDTLIKKCLENANEYTEKLVANLSRLELKLVTSESEITESNILYLFKPDGATSYNQYVVIEGNKVLLGTCDIDMAQYLKIADASKTYATKTELKAVTDKIGTTTLTTTAQTLTGSIEEVKGIAEQGAMLTVTKEQYDQLVAGQTVAIGGKDYTYDDNTYYVVKDDTDTITTTTTIDKKSTDSKVPTAKAVEERVKYMCTTKVADVPKTEITSFETPTITGKVSYFVKNGVCYVSFIYMTNSVIGMNQTMFTGMPKPTELTVTSIFHDNDGTISGMMYIDAYSSVLKGHFYSNKLGYGSFSYPVAES